MKVKLLVDLPTLEGVVPSGQVINIPDHMVDRLSGKVEALPRHRQDVPQGWLPKAKAWLQDGELRTTGVFPDLAVEIVKLTADDLTLQRQLLVDHCGLYGLVHFRILVEAWRERVADLRDGHRLSKDEAEMQAAQECHVLPWLHELRQGTVH